LIEIQALFSSFRNLKFPHNNLFSCEIGLGGEVRNVSGLELRVQEAEKLVFTAVFVSMTMSLARFEHIVLAKDGKFFYLVIALFGWLY